MAYEDNAFGGRTFAQDLFAESSTQKLPLGTVRILADGRRFVYCSATAAALAAGVCVSKAVAPQDATIAALDAAQNVIGATKIYLTLTGAPTLNQYKDGYLIITAGTGIGEIYKIKGNTADDNPASGRVTLYLYDKLKTTHVAASTTISIFENPYSSVLINPAEADGDATTGERILGVTVRPITASYYFWAQTWGIASVQLDVDAAAGTEADERILVPGTTAGRLAIVAAGAEADRPRYGQPFETADLTDAEANLVMLQVS